ncbi:MAG: tetratricopeptide repeat protein [Candidatus Omnitrophota bacterium]
MAKILLTVVFVFTLTTLAFADYDAGLSAYKRGDFATASQEWRPLAEKGDAKAQNAIGVMYATGKGFPQDYTKAIKWYRKAAEGGYLAAMRNLGSMYAGGEGVAQDFGKAAKWYRAAAERGDHAALHKITRFYAEGTGVPQDYVQAYTWSLILDCSHPEELEQRQAIAGELTAEQITAAKKNAAEWKAKK